MVSQNDVAQQNRNNHDGVFAVRRRCRGVPRPLQPENRCRYNPHLRDGRKADQLGNAKVNDLERVLYFLNDRCASFSFRPSLTDGQRATELYLL